MRRIFQKELDMILHWNLTLVGGFLGTYAILLHAGNFGSAQTGNVMEMAAALTGKNDPEQEIYKWQKRKMMNRKYIKSIPR